MEFLRTQDVVPSRKVKISGRDASRRSGRRSLHPFMSAKEDIMAQKRVVIIGGHGKIALLAAPKLAASGFDVDAVIRDPDQVADVEAAGASPIVLDVENATKTELAKTFDGAHAVVFSAGAGGGNPQRTQAVDRDAAILTMDTAAEAGVQRYIMVSYSRADQDVHELDPENSFYPYAKAKYEADQHLRGTDLQYTILGPGMLTEEPETGLIDVVDAEDAARRRSQESAGAETTSRSNVAAVIAHCLRDDVGARQTIRLFDGSTPIADALS